jgi:hypothetical protein
MNSKIVFIIDNINEVMVQDRREILQLIYNSPSRSKLKEKGGGTQIKLDDLSDLLVDKIYNLILDKLTEQKIVL